MTAVAPAAWACRASATQCSVRYAATQTITGALPPLPGPYAMIPEADIDSFPHYGGKGCAAIGITPEDVRQRIQNVVPEGFNSLPATLPAYN